MAAVKNKVSPWFKHPSGVGWKCVDCGRCNSCRVKVCDKCGVKHERRVDSKTEVRAAGGVVVTGAKEAESGSAVQRDL